MEPFVVLRQLSKSFTGVSILRGIDLEIDEAEVLVLLGQSGSGKTTLLRMIAGFEAPDQGEILVRGEDVSRDSPERRNFGMVFQHYALFPHMTVGENVAFGLEARHQRDDEIRQRTAEMLEIVGLSDFRDRRIQEISGGQQQRVALARALAPHPRLLLLDEPLSNLDPELRERTRRQIRTAVNRVGITAIWVTHEQEEAFDVADRIALLNRGRVEQVGRPEELYLEPGSPFVASFVGRSSALSGSVAGEGLVVVGDPRFRGHGARWPAAVIEATSPDQPVEILFRPESLCFGDPEVEGVLLGEVAERRFIGESTLFVVELVAGGQVLVRGEPSEVAVGDRVGVKLREAGPLPRAYGRGSEESP